MALTTVPASLSATAITLTTAAQPNITSVGTLTGLTVSGNIAGTLTTAAQTNITSLGTLTGLTVNGNTTIRSGSKLTINRADNATGGEITYGPTGTGFIFNDVNGDDTIFKTGSTEHMRIDAATSRVGIGGINPNTNLQLYHATDDISINVNHGTGGSYPKKSGISFGATSTSLGGDATFTGGAGIQVTNTAASNNPTEMAFFTTSGGTPTTRMLIDSSGNVGIGTNSPSGITNGKFLEIKNTSTGAGTHAQITLTGSNGHTNLLLASGDDTTGGDPVLSSTTNHAIRFGHSTNSTFAGFSEHMRIDSSGTVGIGTTDIHSWAAFDGRLRVGARGFFGTTGASTQMGYNWYYDGAYKYIAADVANRYYQNGGNHVWETAASGSADGTITWSGKMIIDSDGDVGIGQTNPSAKLDVVGGGSSTSPTLELNSSTSTLFNHAVNAFNSNLTAGENSIFIIGKEGSTKNSGYIGYKWNGAASDTNLVTFGHWSSDNLMNLTADGRLGIGTQTPASYDTDSGGISADLVVANSGHAGIVVASGTGSDAGIFFGDGTGNAAYRGAVSYVNSQDRMYFKASGGNFLTLDNTKLNASYISLDVGIDTATVNFTDSVSNTHTKYIEIGANGSTSLGDALLVTHSAGSGVGYFGYESGNDRLIIACDNGGGNNTIEFSVNAGTATGGTTDNLNGATAALTIGGDEVVTTSKHVRQSGAPGFKVKDHSFTKGIGWEHIGANILTVDYNNNSSGWNSSTGVFTPTRAGYYLFSFGGWANASTNGARYATSFAKNNSLTYISGGDYCSVDSPLNGHSEVIYMNGSTDYVRLYAYSAISCTWGTSSHAAWWSAMWLH